MDREYQIMTSDNRAIPVKAIDIKEVEKPKDDKYQESGVNPENKSEVNIKGTPFDLDPDK
jgi:hypothetical protein